MRSFFVLFLLIFAGCAAAQPREDELKAELLLKFLSFVEFPHEALPAPAPLGVGLVGGEQIAAALQQILAGRSAEGRSRVQW